MNERKKVQQTHTHTNSDIYRFEVCMIDQPKRAVVCASVLVCVSLFLALFVSCCFFIYVACHNIITIFVCIQIHSRLFFSLSTFSVFFLSLCPFLDCCRGVLRSLYSLAFRSTKEHCFGLFSTINCDTKKIVTHSHA